MPFSNPLRRGRDDADLPLRWVRPASLLLAAFGALIVCIYGSPWGASAILGAVVSLVSALPLFVLMVLIVRIYRRGELLQRELQDEQKEAESLNIKRLVQEMRGARDEARERRNRFSPSGTTLLPLGEARAPWVSSVFETPTDADTASSPAPGRGAGASAPEDQKDGMVKSAMDYVKRHFVACEEVRLDQLRDFMGEHALNRTESLQHLHEVAFLFGLVGTALGFFVQIFVTQYLTRDGLTSQPFMTGVILKAGATVVGILVALYARSLRLLLLPRYERLGAKVENFVSANLAQYFIEAKADKGDLAANLKIMFDDLKTTIGGIGGSVRSALDGAIEDLGKTLGNQIKTALTTGLSQAIEQKIAVPFRAEMAQTRADIGKAHGELAEGTQVLNASAAKLVDEMIKTWRASDRISEKLEQAGSAIQPLIRQFEEIVKQARGVAEALQDYQGEVELVTKTAREASNEPAAVLPSVELFEFFREAQRFRETTQNVDRNHQELMRKFEEFERGRR